MLGQILKIGHKTVKFVTLDARRLYLDISNIAFFNPTMDKDDNYIKSISLEDKITISNGDEITLRVGSVKTVYEVEYMVIEKKGKAVVIYSALPTKTEMFLLPVLNKTKLALKHETYFVSAQLDHTYKFMCLKYRFTGTTAYKEFEKTMLADPLCVSHLEHGPYHVIYIFKIPSGFNEDVLSLIGGEYSKFSKALKGRISKFHGRENSEPMIDVIDRNKHLRESMEKYLGVSIPVDSELASKPDINVEIYKPYE